MKQLLLYLILLLACSKAAAQHDFIGIARYKITVEGNDNPVTDSMSVVFGQQKIKVILYLPDLKNPGHIVEKSFIDDFKAKKSFDLNAENKTYKTDILKTGEKYNFINTMKIEASNNTLCFLYKADTTSFDRSQISAIDCLCSINYRNSFIINYFFLGIQPVIFDNRIVMDFAITKPNGVKQRIYIFNIKKMADVESYFNLNEYKQEK